jgi:hypothetical protein
MIQAGGKILLSVFHKLINSVWNKEELPDQCKESIIVVLYGCETWSLTLREVHKLRVFENRVLRRIFGPWRDEVMGGRRKLHKEALHDLCSLPSIIRIIKSRRMRWAGSVARMGEKRKSRGKDTTRKTKTEVGE